MIGIGTVAKIVPLVIQVVDWAEDKFRGKNDDGSGRGAERKAWAMDEVISRVLKGDVKEFFDIGDIDNVNWLEVVQDRDVHLAVEDLIDSIVLLRNRIGKHQKKD